MGRRNLVNALVEFGSKSVDQIPNFGVDQVPNYCGGQ